MWGADVTEARRWSRFAHDVVDDADDDGAHRTVLRIEHLPGAVAFVEHEDALVGAGADRIGGDEVVAGGLAVLVDLLDHEQAARFVERMLDRSVDLADDAPE